MMTIRKAIYAVKRLGFGVTREDGQYYLSMPYSSAKCIWDSGDGVMVTLAGLDGREQVITIEEFLKCEEQHTAHKGQ